MPTEIHTTAYACRYCFDGIQPWHWDREGYVFRHLDPKEVENHENTHRSVLKSEARGKRLAKEAEGALAKEFGNEWKVRWKTIFYLALRFADLYQRGGPWLFTMSLRHDLQSFLTYST